tara:strand:- start:92 stop:658 length:567 start_codon:yes stop_codon:yes gene_type:complete
MKSAPFLFKHNLCFLTTLFFLLISSGCSKNSTTEDGINASFVGTWNYSNILIVGRHNIHVGSNHVQLSLNQDYLGTWRVFSCNEVAFNTHPDAPPSFSCLEADITEEHAYDKTLEYADHEIRLFDWRVKDDHLILFFDDLVKKFKYEINDDQLKLDPISPGFSIGLNSTPIYFYAPTSEPLLFILHKE